MELLRKPGTVLIFTTGGTIAGSGEAGQATGYRSGQISGQDLIASVPGLEQLAPIEVIPICSINSDDITADIWLNLLHRIEKEAADPNVAGFVITHGTDTMEETAFFLHCTLHTQKPVVLTGAMRPATALSPDGPMNLYQAVTVAADPASIGQGVLVVFSDFILSGRDLQKTSTHAVTAMSGGTHGCVGIVSDGSVRLFRAAKPAVPFDLTAVAKLKQVSVLYFHAEADPALLHFAMERSDGIVIAGAGMGQYSEAWMDAIAQANIPVVISSRINSGFVTEKSLLNATAIAANDLPPQKAAILLRLALAMGITERAQLQKIFDEI